MDDYQGAARDKGGSCANRQLEFPKVSGSAPKMVGKKRSNLRKVTSTGMTRIFKPHSQEMAEIRRCVYCKKQDHKSVDCKTVSTVDNHKRVLSNKCLISIALETNTELIITRALPCARFVRRITPPSAIALVTI